MKILEAVQRVKRPEPRYDWDQYPPLEALCEELSIKVMWEQPKEVGERLRVYPIFNWLCTDEMVGLDALYFDDEPVAAVMRIARKSHYLFEWLSKEAADKVRLFLVSFAELKFIDILGPDEEIPVDQLEYQAGRPVVLEVD